jgi:signal recognition particle subunit SRP54
MEQRLRAGQFTFDDFLAAQKMVKRMGPIQGVMKLIPGVGNQLKDVQVDERQLARVEAIVLSMTPQERRLPHVINGSRRQRIARGAGVSLDEVNRLMSARKQMEKLMGKMRKGGDLGALLPPDMADAAQGGSRARPHARSGRRKKSRR